MACIKLWSSSTDSSRLVLDSAKQTDEKLQFFDRNTLLWMHPGDLNVQTSLLHCMAHLSYRNPESDSKLLLPVLSDERTVQSPEVVRSDESVFYYFAYGSCMCPVDLKRTLGESTHSFVIGPATLQGYRLGFYRRSVRRNCGVLDVVSEPNSVVEGVLYALPWRLSDRLDEREEVPTGGYRRETVEIQSQQQRYTNVRTYVVVNKLDEELAPNDWYFNVVLRGAVTCGLPEQYCWQLFNHMHQLQQRHWQDQHWQNQTLRSA